ncbi:MAG: response regulator [Pyrinomonadaceae bacterium]|nr:response regulator [Pyrinomonadaceae bacterium]
MSGKTNLMIEDKRILIIDDEDHIRRMFRLTLETAGYEVSEAGDGQEGLAAFGDGSEWDAVLLDQKMAGMDGLETLRRIKERAPGARVIMVTAFASIELAVDAMKFGATDFVRKPMTPEILRQAVAAALEKPVEAPRQSISPSEAGVTQPKRLPVETLTMNGFSFVRAADVEDAPDESNERRFRVKTLKGQERLVVVEIDPEAVAYVERMTRRRLPPESSFWTHRAEHVLSLYLWNEGGLPSNGKLTVSDISREELEIAARWEKE